MTIEDGHQTCPYSNLPPTSWWQAAVAAHAPEAFNPHWQEQPPFLIRPDMRVATLGSCFAQNISRWLPRFGLKYFVAEPGFGWLSAEERQTFGYGVFSVRCGNVYTAAQLHQLFRRAQGQFVPNDEAWLTGPQQIVDPFRPRIQPGGFATEAEMKADRTSHLRAVSKLFAELDVLIVTLGLTEGWRSKINGSVYPVCPGCGAGTFDPDRHEFHNYGVTEVVADLAEFLTELQLVNPRAKTILTVSPVPLIATYEDRHVAKSTTYSKSVLRVAADEIASRIPQVHYFGAYEIVMSYGFRGFLDDRRTVRPEVVEHVMNVFHNTYVRERFEPLVEPAEKGLDLTRTVECDEEALAVALGSARPTE